MLWKCIGLKAIMWGLSLVIPRPAFRRNPDCGWAIPGIGFATRPEFYAGPTMKFEGATAMTALPRILASACLALALAPMSASADTTRIYVTNAAGDSVHVIDPATNKVVQTFKGPEAMHGINFSPDGARVYLSNEEGSTLDVFDRKTGKLIKQVPLSNRPNNIAVAKDGRIVVGIARGDGALDIIDPASLALKKTIPVHGRLHNVYVTPDGKYVITGSIRESILTVIDLATEQVAWELKLSGGVRPMTIETNPDGSTKRIFAQLSDLNGFAVVDFANRKETAREIGRAHV